MKKGERATIREIVNKTAYHYEACIDFGFDQKEVLELTKGFQKALFDGKYNADKEEKA